MSVRDLQTALAQARLAYWKAKVAVAEAQLAELDDPQKKPEHIDLSNFRPEWKRGTKISKAGAAAIFAAFDQHKRIREVAKLLNISERSAGTWHIRWEKHRNLKS
jgi:hypothetical protein